MEEAKASYVCDYDPNIPITTEAEPFLISSNIEVPTIFEIEEYQSLLQRHENKGNLIKQLLIEKITLIKEIETKNKQIEELRSSDDKKALMKYEEVIYELLPTDNKAFIYSNVSGLGSYEMKTTRLRRMRKKDLDEQKRLLYTLGERRSWMFQCRCREEQAIIDQQEAFSPLHSSASVRVN